MPFERPVSPIDGIHLKDDFYGNDSVTDANVGELLWEIVTIGNASTYAAVAGPYGILRMTTAATADGDGSVLRLDEDMLYVTAGVGGIAFRVRYPSAAGNQLAGNNFRIGLSADVAPTIATPPTDSVSVQSDAGVITLRVDSADHGDQTAAAANVSTMTGGNTMVLDEWHVFDLRWSGENGQGGPRDFELFIDGEIACSLIGVIDNDESLELSISHFQDTGGAADLELDIDYIEFWHWRPDKYTAPAV